MTVYGPKVAKTGKNGRILGLSGIPVSQSTWFQYSNWMMSYVTDCAIKTGQMRTDLAQITKTSAKLGCGGP